MNLLQHYYYTKEIYRQFERKWKGCKKNIYNVILLKLNTFG